MKRRYTVESLKMRAQYIRLLRYNDNNRYLNHNKTK